MKNFIAFVEGLMVKLSTIPGLRFLADYVTEFRGRRTQREQTIGQYQSYVQTIRGAASDVTQAARGQKKQVAARTENDADVQDINDTDDEFEDEEDDDFESYGF